MEQILISGLFASPRKYLDVCEFLRADDFATPPARAVYATFTELFKAGKPVTWETVYINTPDIYKSYVARLSSDASPAAVVSVGKKIVEDAKKRRILAGLNEIKKSAKFSEASELLGDMARIYNDEMRQVSKKCDSCSVVERFLERQLENRKTGALGWSFNITKLDKEFIQLRPGNLMVIGGFTSVGKTALMVELVRRFGPEPHIAIFSTEMMETDITARLIANFAGFNANKVLAGKLYDNQWQEQSNAVERVKEMNLHIYDNIFKIDQMEQEVTRLKLQGKCDIVFIDFFQNIQSSGRTKYEKNADLAIRLQQFLLNSKTAGICLSQISNEAAKTDSGLIEFKGAGEIAAACDIGVWIRRSKEDEKILLWETRKNRHGAKPCFMLRFRDNWEGFEEWNN